MLMAFFLSVLVQSLESCLEKERRPFH